MKPRVESNMAVGVLLRSLLALWLAVCPMLGAMPTAAAAASLPAGFPVPVEENENEEEGAAEVRTAAEWVAPTRADRRQTELAASFLALLSPPVRLAAPLVCLSRPAPSDPFHNGLGSPYHC